MAEAYYEDAHIKIYNKDCRAMSELGDNSVQCVVTSPPYWGLRKYSGQQELIWGDNNCEHQWVDGSFVSEERTKSGGSGCASRTAGKLKQTQFQCALCSLCGAWKGAYGLEPTPEMYIEHTIEILREIRRVLRKDGVVFWNIGDSYSSGGRKTNKPQTVAGGSEQDLPLEYSPSRDMLEHLVIKPKDLCLIPFRLAIACQEAGWWVRSVIIWSKPNPMPESVTDRPTESHEYILMLTKAKNYYWDAEAVRSPLAEGSWERAQRSELTAHSESRIRNKGTGIHGRADLAGRNIRTVWEFPTQPYPEAHFAVFPEKLPEICIKAATPEVGCCSKCGAPWVRITEHHRPSDYDPNVVDEQYAKQARKSGGSNGTNRPLSKIFKDSLGSTIETLGWQPTCSCNADKVPSLVLDPFLGAGTVAWVAKKLNRRCIGYEISEEYCRLAVERCRQQVMGLND